MNGSSQGQHLPASRRKSLATLIAREWDALIGEVPEGYRTRVESAFGWRCRLKVLPLQRGRAANDESPPAQNGPCRHPATGADEPLVTATALLVPNVTDDRGRSHYRLLRIKSVIRVVNHDRCDLPSGVGFLHQVDDAGPLQFFSVGLATNGDAPGDHGGCT